jgi:predicted nucleic-acid-binding protein
LNLGLDTSVVLRLLTGQPQRQAAAARIRLEQAVAQGEEIFVTDLVLGEIYFALHHHYRVPEDQARKTVLSMLRSNVVSAVPPEAIKAFEPAAGAGVMDRLIHERHRALSLVTLTFDRQMSKLEGAVRLPSR